MIDERAGLPLDATIVRTLASRFLCDSHRGVAMAQMRVEPGHLQSQGWIPPAGYDRPADEFERVVCMSTGELNLAGQDQDRRVVWMPGEQRLGVVAGRLKVSVPEERVACSISCWCGWLLEFYVAECGRPCLSMKVEARDDSIGSQRTRPERTPMTKKRRARGPPLVLQQRRNYPYRAQNLKATLVNT